MSSIFPALPTSLVVFSYNGALIALFRYICEISPSARRGVLVSLPQFMAALGICMGYFTCYGSIHIDSSISWRLPFILMAVFAGALAASCLYLPSSPRWLLLHGRRGDAIRAVERLNISSAEAEKDIFQSGSAQVQLTTVPVWSDFLSIFKRQYRLRTILGLFVLGMVQLSGIDGVLYVSTPLEAFGPWTLTDMFISMLQLYSVRLV